MSKDNYSKELLLQMYESMLTSRRFDEKLIELFKENLIPGFVHLGIGQEAMPVGGCLPLREDDYLLYSHRGFGHCIAKGIPVNALMAEELGKKTGSSGGKGGDAHVAADLSKGVVGQGGTLGSCFPLSVGIGLSIKNIKKSDQVAIAFFGDGSANRETFHSSLNMAALWDLPVVYFCENNNWAISVPMERSTSVDSIAKRAAAYNIPGVKVDGTDVVEVYSAVEEAVARARNGEGPTLIEATAYRWRPHSEGFPYFEAKDDAEKGKDYCPLEIFKEKYVGEEISTSDIEEIEARVNDIISEAAKFAKESPMPEPQEAFEDVYYKG